MNESFCQKSDDGFTCICPSGCSGVYCEISCAERGLNMNLCLNEGICVDESGHTYFYRLVFIYLQLTKYIFRKAYEHPSSNAL